MLGSIYSDICRAIESQAGHKSISENELKTAIHRVIYRTSAFKIRVIIAELENEGHIKLISKTKIKRRVYKICLKKELIGGVI